MMQPIDLFRQLRPGWTVAICEPYFFHVWHEYVRAIHRVKARMRSHVQEVRAYLRENPAYGELAQTIDAIQRDDHYFNMPWGEHVGVLRLKLEQWLHLEGRLLVAVRDAVPTKAVVKPQAPQQLHQVTVQMLANVQARRAKRQAFMRRVKKIDLRLKASDFTKAVRSQRFLIQQAQRLALKKQQLQHALTEACDNYREIIKRPRKRFCIFTIKTNPKRYQQLHELDALAQSAQLDFSEVKGRLDAICLTVSSGALKRQLTKLYGS